MKGRKELNFRHFLHRQGVFHAPYWSCFDAIQEVKKKKAAVFSFHNLDWPEGIEFVYTPFVVIAYLHNTKYAQIDFGEAGNPIQVSMYKKEVLSRRNIYDDRGFVSSTEVYDNGRMLYTDYLTEGENLIASYRDNLHTICFNVDYLDTQSAEKSIDSICHEAQHAYQSRLVDAMHEVGEKNRDLQVFQRAALYEQEFNHYKTASKSFSGYYNQACETDARTYGKIRTQTYMNAIEAYCRGTDTP